MEIQKVRENIVTVDNELAGKKIQFVGEGMDSKAFLVDGKYIFRFPKFASVGVALQREVCLLPQLQHLLSVAIPEFLFVGTQVGNGLPFVGYDAIQGVGMDKRPFWEMDALHQQNIITTLAYFYQTLHAFPVEKAVACGVKVEDFRQMYQHDWDRIRAEGYHLLDEVVRNAVDKMYEGYLGNAGNFQYTPTLLHADLSEEHVILKDDGRGEIAGIIDFGDLCIGDPLFDFMWWYEELGEPFVLKLWLAMNHTFKPTHLSRLRFFYQANFVQDILAGLDRQDKEALQWGIKGLTSLIENK